METDKIDLLGVSESLRTHGTPGQIAFTFYELLQQADYTDEEISEVADALNDIVS